MRGEIPPPKYTPPFAITFKAILPVSGEYVPNAVLVPPLSPASIITNLSVHQLHYLSSILLFFETIFRFYQYQFPEYL